MVCAELLVEFIVCGHIARTKQVSHFVYFLCFAIQSLTKAVFGTGPEIIVCITNIPRFVALI